MRKKKPSDPREPVQVSEPKMASNPRQESESAKLSEPMLPNESMNKSEPSLVNDSENEIIWKLSKDLIKSAKLISQNQARLLVDLYYSMQEYRIRAGGQIRALTESGEPTGVLDWTMDKFSILEGQAAAALKMYAEGNHMGQWAMEVKGIGPIIAAGLLAHIDITRAPTVGHIWRFAGLDPTCKWGKGLQRPWNASLKVICWKIGESFVKVSNHPEAYYGKVYQERKALEIANNEALKYKDQADAILKSNPKHAQAKIYKTGKLSPGHIHSRAKRYAVKLFLSHWHGEAYRHHFKKEPPLPYPIAILGHAHAA